MSKIRECKISKNNSNNDRDQPNNRFQKPNNKQDPDNNENAHGGFINQRAGNSGNSNDKNGKQADS